MCVLDKSYELFCFFVAATTHMKRDFECAYLYYVYVRTGRFLGIRGDVGRGESGQGHA
jgi:hypothetical protein